ncbi:MAG TPA: diacylglycerol kinase family protein [Blastocatellia bacterium]|nr:diacylglycerol kinase family protein [Blastocatellia bacterium]
MRSLTQKNRRLGQSFRNAGRGIILALRTERNIRIQTVCATTASLVGLWLDLSPVELALIFVAIGLVLAAEMINSAIERLSDVVTGGEFDPRIRQVKDIAAGGVLVAAVTSALIGIAIYLPALIRKFAH